MLWRIWHISEEHIYGVLIECTFVRITLSIAWQIYSKRNAAVKIWTYHLFIFQYTDVAVPCLWSGVVRMWTTTTNSNILFSIYTSTSTVCVHCMEQRNRIYKLLPYLLEHTSSTFEKIILIFRCCRIFVIKFQAVRMKIITSPINQSIQICFYRSVVFFTFSLV